MRNTLRTAAIEQAAHDKHLLYYAPRNTHVDLKFPEYVHLQRHLRRPLLSRPWFRGRNQQNGMRTGVC